MNLKDLSNIHFYRYLINRVQKMEVGTYIFLDYRVCLFFIVLLCTNLFLFYPGKIEYYTPTLDSQISVIETLARIVSIFLGVLFSFIALSFNVFYKYFGRFAFRSYFTLSSIRVLFTVILLTLAYLTYSLSYLKEVNYSTEYSSALFVSSISLTILSTLLIIPTIIYLLRQSQSRRHIKSLITKLDKSWISSYYENIEWGDQEEKHYEQDPITLLTETGTQAIKEFDFTTFKIITQSIVQHFEKNIKIQKSVSPQWLYWELTKMFLNLFQVAVKERNENALLNIVHFRGNLENLVLDNINKPNFWDQADQYEGFDFQQATKEYFNRSVQFNEDAVSEHIIEVYREFGTKLINIIFPGKFEYDFDDRMKSHQQQAKIHNYLNVLTYLMSVITTSEKYHIYGKLSNLFYSLDMATINSINTNNTKQFLLHVIGVVKYETFETYISASGVKTLEALDYPYYIGPAWALDAGFDIPLKGKLKSINLMFVRGVLGNMGINGLKAITFHLIKSVSEKGQYKTQLLTALSKFSEIRDFINENDTDYRKEIYIKLDEYFGYIKQHLINVNLNDKEIADNVKKISEGFTYTDKFKQELTSKGHIFDERIL